MIIKDMAARIGKIMTENEAFIKEIDRLKEEISHLIAQKQHQQPIEALEMTA